MEDTQDETLENRGLVLRAVRANPGVHMRELQRILDMPTGLLKFHLEALDGSGSITSQKDRYYRRYYPVKTLTGDERVILSCLRQTNPRRIVIGLLEEGTVNHKDLMDMVGLKPSTLSFYLKDMVDKGVVVRQKKGRVNLYRVADRDAVLAVLGDYRPSFLDAMVDRFLETWFER